MTISETLSDQIKFSLETIHHRNRDVEHVACGDDHCRTTTSVNRVDDWCLQIHPIKEKRREGETVWLDFDSCLLLLYFRAVGQVGLVCCVFSRSCYFTESSLLITGLYFWSVEYSETWLQNQRQPIPSSYVTLKSNWRTPPMPISNHVLPQSSRIGTPWIPVCFYRSVKPTRSTRSTSPTRFSTAFSRIRPVVRSSFTIFSFWTAPILARSSRS